MNVVAGALQDVGGKRGVSISGLRAVLPGCPVPEEVGSDRLAVVADLPGDLGHVRPLLRQGDHLPGVGLGDHRGWCSPAEAMSTGMVSSVALVMDSVPSRTA